MKRGTEEANYTFYNQGGDEISPQDFFSSLQPHAFFTCPWLKLSAAISTLAQIKTAALQSEAGDSRHCLRISTHAGMFDVGTVSENRRLWVLLRSPCHGAVMQRVCECTERADSPGSVLFWEPKLPSNTDGGLYFSFLLLPKHRNMLQLVTLLPKRTSTSWNYDPIITN